MNKLTWKVKHEIQLPRATRQFLSSLDVQARNGKTSYLFDTFDCRLRHLVVLTKKPTLLVLRLA